MTPEAQARQRAGLRPPFTPETARLARQKAQPALDRYNARLRANFALARAQAGHTKPGPWLREIVRRLEEVERRLAHIERYGKPKPKRKPAGQAQAQAQPTLDGAPSPSPSPTEAPLDAGQSWSPSPNDTPPTLDR